MPVSLLVSLAGLSGLALDLLNHAIGELPTLFSPSFRRLPGPVLFRFCVSSPQVAMEWRRAG